MVAVRDRNIDSLSVRRRSPLDSSERSAWPHRCAPNYVAVIGIQRPKDTALLSEPDNIFQQIGTRPSQIEIRAGWHRAVRVCCPSWENARHRPGVEALEHP